MPAGTDQSRMDPTAERKGPRLAPRARPMTTERSVGRSCPASSDDGGRDGVEGAVVRVAARRTPLVAMAGEEGFEPSIS